MKNTILNWSGGKDCAMALYRLLSDETYRPVKFLTTLNGEKQQVPMHEIPEILIHRQAESCGFAVEKLYLPHNASNPVYEEMMKDFWMKEQNAGNTASAYGDIFLQDVRNYREKLLREIGIEPVFPLWNMNTRELIREFINLGFKAIITSADNRYFDQEVLGKTIDNAFIGHLPADVDPCGENGEFHTFVYDGPVFDFPVKFIAGEAAFTEYTGAGTDKPGFGIWHLKLTPDG
ncbi:MAG: ATP-binding protein [Bacteroidales bacterium]